jgi:hypothetical protein
MGNSYTDSKGNTSTSNINNTKSGLPRSQEVDVKKHYTTDGDLHLNKNHVSNSNPHIRDVYSPLQKLSMQALRRYGEFAPESVDGNVLLMFIDFANEIIEDVRVHPYFSDNYEIEYYTHMTDKSYLQGKEYDTFTGTETSKTDSNSVTAKTGVPTEDTT